MKLKSIKEKLYYLIAISLSVFLLFFFITGIWIGYEVNNVCHMAKQDYTGDCIESLSSLLIDENRGFKTRNSAIWALGQLGDKRAYPLLQSYYTNIIPDREPLDQTISQYELQKAINLTSGGTNITAFIWRGVLNTP